MYCIIYIFIICYSSNLVQPLYNTNQDVSLETYAPILRTYSRESEPLSGVLQYVLTHIQDKKKGGENCK